MNKFDEWYKTGCSDNVEYTYEYRLAKEAWDAALNKILDFCGDLLKTKILSNFVLQDYIKNRLKVTTNE